jgi:hypothetical protein
VSVADCTVGAAAAATASSLTLLKLSEKVVVPDPSVRAQPSGTVTV